MDGFVHLLILLGARGQETRKRDPFKRAGGLAGDGLAGLPRGAHIADAGEGDVFALGQARPDF
jgi:hypothetical protein